MKKATYINRYGDKIIFEEIGDNEIGMSGFVHYRWSPDFMVDPSGGPYIEVGMDIGRYFEDGIERRVISIFKLEEKFILTYN